MGEFIGNGVGAIMQQQVDFSYKFQNMRPALDKISFTDQRTKIRLSEALFFLNFSVVFMPASLLRLFSFDWYHLPMLHRIRADVAYLELVKPAFADAYIGGIFLQFFFCALVFLLRIYFWSRSKEIYCVTGEAKVKITSLVVIIIFTICCTLAILNVSAYGLNGSHSWFESKPSGNPRGMPATANNTVFLFTGLFMPVIFWPFSSIALLTIEVLYGRKIKIDELFRKVGKNAGE
jgi:hypothetical protein